MSFGGLVLTNAGRNELIRAEMGEKFSITHVVFGDGRYNGAYTAINSLVSQVIEVPITRISRTDEEVLLECDFNSQDVPKAFYLREIGIVANGILCYYDNSREDAEYIDPASDILVKQKRMRFVLLISSDIEVNVKIESSLYALAEDLESVIHPKYVESVGLEEPEDKDDIFAILGKIKKSIKELIAHVGNNDNPHNETKEHVGLGNADNTSDADKPVSTAQQAALDALYEQLTAYTRQKIADLINGAPESLDTLKEVYDAIAAHNTIMEALDAAIGKKASAAEFDSHVKDTTKHITDTERTAWSGKLAPTGDVSNVTATFLQATTRANLTSKEKLSVSLGKAMKWFADLANGAASSLLGTNLTTNRALVSDGSGKVAASSVTATELGYLEGTTSKVQDQLDALNTGLGETKHATIKITTSNPYGSLRNNLESFYIIRNAWCTFHIWMEFTQAIDSNWFPFSLPNPNPEIPSDYFYFEDIYSQKGQIRIDKNDGRCRVVSWGAAAVVHFCGSYPV